MSKIDAIEIIELIELLDNVSYNVDDKLINKLVSFIKKLPTSAIIEYDYFEEKVFNHKLQTLLMEFLLWLWELENEVLYNNCLKWEKKNKEQS